MNLESLSKFSNTCSLLTLHELASKLGTLLFEESGAPGTTEGMSLSKDVIKMNNSHLYDLWDLYDLRDLYNRQNLYNLRDLYNLQNLYDLRDHQNECLNLGPPRPQGHL